MYPRKPTHKTPSALREILAANVRERMQARFAKMGDKVTALATASGVSRSTVQRVLNADYGANLDTIEALAAALRAVPQDLLVPRRAARRPR